jgi:hypothetical protein
MVRSPGLRVFCVTGGHLSSDDKPSQCLKEERTDLGFRKVTSAIVQELDLKGQDPV